MWRRSVKRLFEFNSGHKPFLAPLGPRRRLPSLSRETLERLPPAAAPIAVTVIGGLVLVVMLGWFLSRGANGTPPQAALVETTAPRPEARPEAAETAQGDGPAALAANAAPGANETPAADAPRIAAVSDGAPAMDKAVVLDMAEPATAGVEIVPIEPQPDLGATSAIPRALPAAAAPEVAVAETEAEIEALEARQRREVDADLGAAGPDAGPAADMSANEAAASRPAAPMRAATATQYVNMRAAPDDGAEVLMVVPAQAWIEAEADCGWCAVAYEGRSGYIYRSFIRYAD